MSRQLGSAHRLVDNGMRRVRFALQLGERYSEQCRHIGGRRSSGQTLHDAFTRREMTDRGVQRILNCGS